MALNRIFQSLSASVLFAAVLCAPVSTPAASKCVTVFSHPSPAADIPRIKMQAKYVGEDKGLYRDPVTGETWNVKYYSETERKQYEVFVRDGRFVDGNGNFVDTHWDEDEQAFKEVIFVIDKDFRFFVLPLDVRGRFHHSSLTAGEEAIFAGTISLSEGRARVLSDNSGHYKPDPEQTLKVLRAMKRAGLDLSQMSLEGRIATEIFHTHLARPSEWWL